MINRHKGNEFSLVDADRLEDAAQAMRRKIKEGK